MANLPAVKTILPSSRAANNPYISRPGKARLALGYTSPKRKWGNGLRSSLTLRARRWTRPQAAHSEIGLIDPARHFGHNRGGPWEGPNGTAPFSLTRKLGQAPFSGRFSSLFSSEAAMTKTVTVQAQQRWEYCLETRKTESALLLRLNALGEQGWEAVDVLYYKDIKGIMSWTAFLKRPSATHPANAGQAAAGNSATAMPSPAKDPTPQGFDLNGDEFHFKAAPSREDSPAPSPPT